MKLYGELAGWYRLIDPPRDHEVEAATHRQLIERVAPGARTLLELGAGAGHNPSTSSGTCAARSPTSPSRCSP